MKVAISLTFGFQERHLTTLPILDVIPTDYGCIEKIIIERWWRDYNQIRPHSSLHYRPHAPEAVLMPPLAAPVLASVTVTIT